MAALDDVFSTVSDAEKEFSSKYSLLNDSENGRVGYYSGDTPLAKDDNGNYGAYTTSNGFNIQLGRDMPYDYRASAGQAGYDSIDPRQVFQVAQKNFGGDTMAALKYRYGDDAQFLQDERFSKYDPTGKGYFAKPTDASRIGQGGTDFSKYPKWDVGDTQPGLFQGALGGDWPLVQIAGLAASGGASFPGFAAGKISGNPLVGNALNFATGNFGGGVDEPYDVGQNLVNNPEVFGNGDLGFDVGQNLQNNPDVFNGGAGAPTSGFQFDPASGQFMQNAAGATAPSGAITPTGIPAAGGAAPGAAIPSSTGAPTTPTGTPVGSSGADVPYDTGDNLQLNPDLFKNNVPGFAQKAIDAVTKNPLAAAGLGLTAYKQYQANQQGKSAQDQLTKNAQPTSDASKELIRQGMAGEVPPAVLQQFQRTAEQAKERIKARYAQMGRDPNADSAAAAEMAKVDEDRDAQVANYASQLLQQGLTAAGVASGPQTAAVTAGVQSDKALSDSMSAALQNYMMLQALQGRQKEAA